MAFSPRGIDALLRGLLTRRQITQSLHLTPAQLGIWPAEWHHYFQKEFVGHTSYVVFFYCPRELWDAYSLHVLACTQATSCPCPKEYRGSLPRAARCIITAMRSARAAGVEASFQQMESISPKRLLTCHLCNIDVVDNTFDDHLSRVHSPAGRRAPLSPSHVRQQIYYDFMQGRRQGRVSA